MNEFRSVSDSHDLSESSSPLALDLTSDLASLPSETLVIGSFESSRDKNQEAENLNELEQLVISYGGNVLDKVLCPLKKINPRTYLGSGKIIEIAELVKTKKAQLVVFDNELTPSQQRNLEKELQVLVADRSEIILGVFAKHAKSREAKLQIELAQIQHHLPRLKRLWTHLSRQRGGSANQRGEGETQIEVDRRILKKRLEQLKNQIEEVQQIHDVKYQARERSQICSFAIVGYTNAGKSTLMNALTHAGVLVEDKLFATLDTTTRKYKLPNGTESLLIDTVGFIHKLPHLLIAAFKSTLQEATQADFLLHLVDGSNPCVDEHIKITEKVLNQLGAKTTDQIIIFNKIDLIDLQTREDLQKRFPQACFVSSLTQEGFNDLTLRMDECLNRRFTHASLKIPQEKFELVNQIYEMGKVLNIDYIDNDILVTAQLNPRDLGRLAEYLST
jgi:GTP-binding protein HflX